MPCNYEAIYFTEGLLMLFWRIYFSFEMHKSLLSMRRLGVVLLLKYIKVENTLHVEII